MSFTQALTNQTFTQNGAYAYNSTNSKILDLFSSGISSKNKKELILHALLEDIPLALKVAIYLRDIREGQGNRDIFRELINILLDCQDSEMDKIALAVLLHSSEFGRWKDSIEFASKLNPFLKTILFSHYKENLDNGLLCKWLPRQGKLAEEFKDYLNMSHGDYRRMIVKNSKTVEQLMCSKEWEKINYSHVPSIANHKYNAAFLKNDTERRRAFLEKALKGEVKINSSVLYPHTIVNMILPDLIGKMRTMPIDTAFNHVTLKDNILAANALWKQLPNYMQNACNVLPIIDTSGSMTTKATGTSGTCMDIAVGLGLYFASHNTGDYHNLWMNFSSSPQAYKLSGDTLSENIKSLDFRNWSQSTNINAALDFVLKAAKTSPQDTPKMILIVSDMEFDSCGKYTNYEKAKMAFQEAGVDMPTIVFWRVDTKTKAQPCTMNEKGVVLLNGYSPSILEQLLAGDIANYNPYTAMVSIVKDKYQWLDDLLQPKEDMEQIDTNN